MQKFIDWLGNSFSPKMNKINNNVWVASIQAAVMQILPMILVGSLVTIAAILKDFIPSMPNLWPLSDFSFGLVSIFISFLIPYNVMEKKKFLKMRFVAGFTGISLFLMVVKPQFTDAGAVFNFSCFGAGGMFVAIIVGVATSLIMGIFGKFSFFKNDSAMPDFVIAWFDSMLPITICVLIGWFLIFQLNLDLYKMISSVFMPIADFAQTLPGFVLICFLPAFLYSLGISSWVLTPVTNTIYLSAIAANSAAVAAGGKATLIATSETVFSGWIAIGGIGATLPLVIMMCFSKSNKLKAIGRASFIPGVLNINEPVVFGAIAWNPILIVPFWLVSIVIPALTYIVLRMGAVTIPSSVFGMWYCPIGISTWIITKDFRSLILLAVCIALVVLIYFPFFKAYEAQEVKNELEDAEE